MTRPEVDQELERLFSVAREASQPHPAARARIRAGLASRLTSTPAASHLLARPRVWPALGVAAFAVGAAWLWSSGARPGGEALSAAATPRVVQSALPPVPSLPAMPQLEVASPPASASSGAPPSAATTPPPAPGLTAKATGSTSSALDSAAELQLVRAMQQALRAGNPGRALSLAAEHAQRFPRGALSEEREGARAVARCQLAEPGARPAILQAFSHSFGQSPYMARVKAACQ